MLKLDKEKIIIQNRTTTVELKKSGYVYLFFHGVDKQYYKAIKSKEQLITKYGIKYKLIENEKMYMYFYSD